MARRPQDGVDLKCSSRQRAIRALQMSHHVVQLTCSHRHVRLPWVGHPH